MPRQIIESRDTEDVVIANIDREILFQAHNETTNLQNRRALEMHIIDEKTNVQVGEKLGVSGEMARQRCIKGRRELRARLTSVDFEPNL
jgi:DNA-directed RNA polymerase specialized sigma24 family protein